MSDVVREDKASTSVYMTADQYRMAEGLPACSELVKGKVIEMNQPSHLHGRTCYRIAFTLGQHVEQHECGHITTNDSGILTAETPDTVRGADVAFCSFERLPQDAEIPDDYNAPPPEVVFEVLSKTDRWSATYAKIAEYLDIDVRVVVVVDPRKKTARVFRPDGSESHLAEIDSLELPEIKPTFECKVADFF